MKQLKNKTITYIHMIAMLVMLLFVILFTLLLIYEKYNDFDHEASIIRKTDLENQKKTIYFDTQRMLKFIEYKYKSKEPTQSEEELKQEIVTAIEHLFGGEDATRYIFIYDYNGIKISDSIRSDDVGHNYYNLTDDNGVEIVKELLKKAEQPQGGYVEYIWYKPTTQQKSPKVSYAKAFKPWGWMVGTGVYLDEVEKVIDRQREKLKKELIKYMMEILSITLILFGLGWIAVRIVNHLITQEINTFSNFFKETSKNYNTIDIGQIDLIEFRKMVNYVNRMVKEIRGQKEELEEMNLSLEAKVKEKTKHLNIRNQQLIEEKNFSESLVKAQDSFIKHAIHEINTPLAVIITHIDMYKIKFEENRYLSKIEAGTKMIANIFDDLSYMVKKNRFDYHKEPINFTFYLESRINFFDEIALGNQHKIICKIEPDINIYFNEVELQRVIDNNLSNAIKYAKKNSDIMVKLQQNSEHITLEFITHSSKIEDTKRIFEPFHQEEKVKGGFGLGLEIVGSICVKENIKIKVESNDEITTFNYLFKRSNI
ncbi:cache domain-containing protein [bacterium]|nr:cache domain-containing protein [bacterium]MBU1958158.1 cache domain-containing protein [bacterium]